jgi:L-fuconolactonase
MIIDSHHHFWQYSESAYGWISAEMPALRRNFLPPDLAETIRLPGVEAVISVQARQCIAETIWLLDLARQNDFVAGVVGWAPLADPNLRESLDPLQGIPKFRALRHVLQGEPDDDYMLRKDFNQGVSLLHDYGLAYDILIFQKHLPQTLTFVDQHPNQIFVLDHVAKPVIETSTPPAEWEKPIRDLARRENVYCKVSGMVTEVRPEHWDAKLLRPYFNVVLEAFGPQRLMFGSDWPVCLLRASYALWFDTVQGAIADLSDHEKAAIMGGTAAKAYGLTG